MRGMTPPTIVAVHYMLQLSPPLISLEMPKHLVSVLMEPNAVDEGTKVRLESALIPKHAISCIAAYS